MKFRMLIVTVIFAAQSGVSIAQESTSNPPTPPSVQAQKESVPLEQPKALTSAPSEPRLRHFSFGLFLTSTQQVEFDDAYVTSSGGSGPLNVEMELEPSAGIVAEYRNMPTNSWGFQGGGQVGSKQEINEVTMTGSGGSSTVLGDGSYIRTSHLFANAVYRWNKFYIPLGLNYSFHKLDGDEDGTTVKGGIGAQVGVGWQITDLFGLELMSQATMIDLRTETSTGSLDYGTGYLSSLKLFGKFSF